MVIIRNILRSESPQEQPVLRVSTNYMETLQKVQPVSGGSEIKTFLNAEHKLDLYSVGTDNKVFRLRPSSDQYAPYHVEELNIHARQLSIFQPLEGPENNPAVLGIDNSNKLTLSLYDGVSQKYKQSVFEPTGASQKIKQFFAVRGATGKIYANAILDDYSLVNNFFSPSELKWKSDRWVPIQDPDGKPTKVREIAVSANNPVQSSMFAIGLEGKYQDRVLFAEDNFAFTRMRDLGAPIINGGWGKVKHISVVTDANNLLNIFAVEQQTGTVWVKKQKKYAADNKIEFEDWKAVIEKSQFPVKVQRVFAMMQFDQLLEVFCIGEDEKLYHTHQQVDSQGKVNGWTPVFPLGNEVGNTTFTITRNYEGYSEVYSLTHDNQILRFFQAPETSQWFSDKVYTEEIKEEVICVPTHAIDLTVLDNKGIPQPKAEVSISSSFYTSLSINGKSYNTSAVDKVKATSDEMGRLTIYQRANGLAGATLYIETPFTGAGSPLVVEPNLQLQQKIKNITEQDVLNAKDKEGNYLLQEKYRKPENAKSIAAIMQASLNLGDQQQMEKVVYFYSTRGRRGGNGMAKPAFGGQPGSWQIDFSSGFPIYKALSANELAAYVNGMEAGFLGIDWGDMWNAIKNGFNAVVDGIKKIVVSVGEKVKVLFEIVVDGVIKAFEAVIDTVQQVFNMIEGVWNWLKVKAEQLFEWLGYLFAWDDIKRTADSFMYSTNLLLDFTGAAVKYVQSSAEDWIDTIKNNLKKSVDDYLAQSGGATSLGNFGNSYKKPNPDAEHALDHNPLFSAFKANYGKTEIKQQFKAQYEESPIPELVDRLLTLVDNFEFGDGKETFQEAIDYFANIKDNPDQAMDLLFNGILKIGESIALFALDLGKGLILFILDIVGYLIDAFKTIMNAEWHIPIVSAIYRKITGQDLAIRPLELLAYTFAIPSTVLYKIINGKAPFPDNAALQAFKNYFTLEWLEKKAGISEGVEETLVDEAQESVAKNLFKAGYAVCIFVNSFADIGTAASSSVETINQPLGYVSTGSGLMAAVFTMPWIVEVNPGTLFCSKKPGVEFSVSSNIGYLATVLTALRSAAIKIVKQFNPELPDPVIIRIEEISTSVVGGLQAIIYVVEYVLNPDSNPKALARKLTLTIPGKFLRFLSLSELNAETFYIPVGILGVLIFGGYTSSYIINLTDDGTELLEETLEEALDLEY